MESVIFEVDLHCHTTASDGELTPSELVHCAAGLGLKGVGITDHDTIQGWKEAEEAAKVYQIKLVKGIELNTDWNGKEVHILGYELDDSSDYLRHRLQNLRDARKQRMLEIIERFRRLGITIEVQEVQKYAKGESMGRPHIAQALMEMGYVTSIKEAFERYIGRGAPAYVPRYKLTPEEAIELIRESHGVAVLAHPGIYRLEEGIRPWIDAGLQGIEVAHSEHNQEDEQRYRALAGDYHLIMTGGSDFHGEKHKPGVKLGHWGVSEDVIQQILTLAKGNTLK
ncbi:putative metal-dependent phosphoesterase, PHP family [Desulfosporosinus acidiphilus SJ4]|uniref:Putative metal-dependent phosphoesterase, PHP family n=1 Tax=Desulfosporosinus acidiphilus (strain DSM 22704 / JCM 16185 / SJ4) TaxID=646529 RepID=I4D8I1_DESAJ|nr:PHP domain-containing protein [Desulfosporosinus acidiphilus]AFM42105.1 putative metal-dependent phosphoesterase, PHP family [Desulfosporosinus acidiphilus SJ4]